MQTIRPIAILIGALGGQGGGVLAEWLVETATRAGYIAQGTSIPGVAQRTGATTYYVEIHPEPRATLGARRPVLGLYPVPGGVDVVVASELLEAARIVQSGMVSPDRTVLVTSTARALTTTEKMALGDGRVDSDRLAEVARRHSRRFVAFDMDATAREAGTIVSAVMLGAIAGSGVLPFGREEFEAVIRASGVGVDASLRGFAHAFAAMPPSADGTEGKSSARASIAADAPDIAGIGEARLVEFQDRAYADLYRKRLDAIGAAENAIDPHAAHDCALTRETARFLALWMAFDDVIRVADLKSRASRIARVRREVSAGKADVVRIVDYFKPGVPEIAGMLPAFVAETMLAWDRRRRARGMEPLGWPLHLRSDSVSGLLVLRSLAGLKWLRRRGTRFAQEQAGIERWLGAIGDAARIDWQLAFELALCGRLIKGYGATNERGKRNLAHVLDHLAVGGSFANASARAAAIREAREAALADEGGTKLDQALIQHGVPPRPAIPQPIRWVTRRPHDAAHAARSD